MENNFEKTIKIRKIHDEENSENEIEIERVKKKLKEIPQLMREINDQKNK
jgi:hypothetical protein